MKLHQKLIDITLIAILLIPEFTVSFAAEIPDTYTGYVLYTGNVIADVNGITQQTQGAVIVKMDGTTETCATIYDKSALLNNVVIVSPADFGVNLSTSTSIPNISGAVSASSMSIGNKKVSEDIKILDIAACPIGSNHYYSVVDMERIDGLTLKNSDIKFCKTDSNGSIIELILNDVTNDAYLYGVVQHDDSVDENIILGVGQKWKQTSLTAYSLSRTTPMRFSPYIKYDIDMDTNTGKIISYDDTYYQLSYAAPLKSYGSASEITANTAVINGNTYKISDEVQVFYRDNFLFVQTSLQSVSNSKYKLTCYYDKAEKEGGRIRVIIAERK